MPRRKDQSRAGAAGRRCSRQVLRAGHAHKGTGGHLAGRGAATTGAQRPSRDPPASKDARPDPISDREDARGKPKARDICQLRGRILKSGQVANVTEKTGMELAGGTRETRQPDATHNPEPASSALKDMVGTSEGTEWGLRVSWRQRIRVTSL